MPLGLLELGLLLGADARCSGIMAPLGQAVALFAGGWLARAAARPCGLPAAAARLRGGGRRARPPRRASRRSPSASCSPARVHAYALRPPVVHLAAGVHQGPLVITRREVLVGEPGAIVRGGIVVARERRHDQQRLRRRRRERDLDRGLPRHVLDHVSVSGAKLDGIHVRLGGVMIKDCTVDMLGNALGQGIDISYNMDMGMSMVEGCNVVGGMEGIVTHSSMTEIVRNHVSRTQMRGISMTEMSMGS